MNILFAPHNDDEALFASYTILREKPLVVICFDSYVQDWVDWKTRRRESEEAVKILGSKVVFLGLNDKTATKSDLKKALKKFKPDKVWAATGSHKHHKWLGEVATELFPQCRLYSTYEGNNYLVETNWEILPDETEILLKNSALSCYKSQLGKNRPHFDAVIGRSEYYV